MSSCKFTKFFVAEIDQKLVEDAKANPDKFVALYDKYFDQIYRYVARRVNDQESAQDLVSQTFMDAFEHLKDYEWRGFPFSSWLYKIAHNNVLKWYRLQGKVTVDLEAIPEIKDSFDQKEEAIRNEETGEIRKAMAQLDPEEQEIIRLKYFEDVSNIEIAEIIGLSANNIGVRIYRTLKKLKQLIQQ